MPDQPVAVTLDVSEWQFLVTTLQGTSAILQALAALRNALPGFELPITADTMVNVSALVAGIEAQLTPS